MDEKKFNELFEKWQKDHPEKFGVDLNDWELMLKNLKDFADLVEEKTAKEIFDEIMKHPHEDFCFQHGCKCPEAIAWKELKKRYGC